MPERLPEHLPAMGTRLHAVGEAQATGAEPAHGGAGRARAPKRLKEQPDSLLDLLVGIEDDLLVLAIEQADGQGELERAPAGLVEDAPAQARPQHVEFRLAHGPFQAEEETVVKGGRIVDAVLIE